MQARYAHAKQMKRAQKEFKKVRCYLGRVTRDIERKADLSNDPELTLLLSQANQLLKQKKNTPNKLYSLHAPEVECIAKGKIHKRYEFGCKVSVVTTSKDPWVLSISAHHDNPYDGSTLKESLQKAEELSAGKIEQAFVDKGYRGKEHHPEDKKVYVSGKKNLPVALKKLLKGRSGIEPIISHLKHDHGLDRNYLLGRVGDKINAVLAGCGFNLKKILNWIKIEQLSMA